ncbi:MAG TPA: CDP-diacylglycerol--serine O-phosphatidyltransferase [Paludibacteraceae bacterium]|nr:CDP-diacylglycerol--serine O-phosphatidyltransferase [Paludibacteraceae bacterium]HOU69042.1 CDP-diacylglycerol--serine O-phosphatidyltransferase [Paludibacteraceae bacterium]HQF50853.1 CDP-diacylglycerol--serine O-phosphatidyltransferase [Paludibacteraceae bacterium]HQJ90242.1 CDP-diacylglycerol--serine O-phosphatidyltransferase [Paludibacteraceae bacterium]
MKSITSYIPNTITSLNLFSGCISCVMAFNGNFFWAAMFILFASVFDFFDGMMARLLNAHSNIGKELDSLADMVSFGVAPGVVMYTWLTLYSPDPKILPFVAFLIPVFSALRLAKFNIDERQTSSFIGLPTPANAIFLTSFIALVSLEDSVFSLSPDSVIITISQSVYFIVPLIIVFSLLLVCELPMFSLKFHNMTWQDNKVRFIFLGLSVILLLFFWWAAIPMVILLFILMSVGIWLKNKK